MFLNIYYYNIRLQKQTFIRVKNILIFMGWVQKISTEDFVCLERESKSISSRIESRKTDDGWIIYRSHYSDKGINHTEEFVVSTEDKMQQVITALQQETVPSEDSIKQLMLEESRKVEVKIEREYKEYGVEKWKFNVNHDKQHNFAIVRCYDEVDIDIILHEQYRKREMHILREIVDMLGFEGMEDVINMNCYYFSNCAKRSLPSRAKVDSDIGVDII
ncbi:MAG: hypothetical protein ACI8Y7_000622 [Candidatus Woesearchaeota archaeon]